ncbi:hypothetical protein CULT_30086 [[Clostridium] ultunense Esp]|nr:hypothetical protein CULT_30086 [[Clostridium] ultunense Esp]
MAVLWDSLFCDSWMNGEGGRCGIISRRDVVVRKMRRWDVSAHFPQRKGGREWIEKFPARSESWWECPEGWTPP